MLVRVKLLTQIEHQSSYRRGLPLCDGVINRKKIKVAMLVQGHNAENYHGEITLVFLRGGGTYYIAGHPDQLLPKAQDEDPYSFDPAKNGITDVRRHKLARAEA